MTDKEILERFLSVTGGVDADFKSYLVTESQFKDKVRDLTSAEIDKIFDLDEDADIEETVESRKRLLGMYNRFERVDKVENDFSGIDTEAIGEIDADNELFGDIDSGIAEIEGNPDEIEDAIANAMENVDGDMNADDLFGSSPSSQDPDNDEIGEGEGQGEGEGDGEGQGEGEGEGEGQGEGEGDGEGQGEGEDEGEGQGEGEDEGEGQGEGEGEDQGEGDGEGQGEGDGEGQAEGDGEGEGESENQNNEQNDSLERQIAIVKSQAQRLKDLDTGDNFEAYIDFLETQENIMQRAIQFGDATIEYELPFWVNRDSQKFMETVMKQVGQGTDDVTKRNKLIVQRIWNNILKSSYDRVQDVIPDLFLSKKDIVKIEIINNIVEVTFKLDTKPNTIKARPLRDSNSDPKNFLNTFNQIEENLEKQALNDRFDILEENIEENIDTYLINQDGFSQNDNNFDLTEVLNDPELIIEDYD